MIRKCTKDDQERIYYIKNEITHNCEGVIPDD